MKLIDILVRDLQKFGGWPKGAVECHRFVDEANIDFYDKNGDWGEDCYLKYGPFAQEAVRERDSACESESVKLEQYEAALAASKQVWDGEGMPPIGSKVSFFYNERYDYHKEIIPEHGQELEVVAHKTTTDGHDVAVCYWDKSGGGMAVCLVPGSLLPIRSEADKKREEAVIALSRVDPKVVPFEYGDKCSDGSLIGSAWYDLYDAIAAGKIPHIRIE